ncbi:DUF6090 family protein [Poritiphilus flavus]|uniref:Uncharacterized protein n=1 Tax=Poritiphilus flavus TaxID=2697053 RepID=A0A6L9EGC0_9FLAO|nr:DUF6090 family protein [Poritiphilus flavus]NAS13706.1 hypothetical protein [Poritiphilus flavus]
MYAIGEIILVVIGILIAIQINNWNENRKKLSLLKSYEENLIAELQADLMRIKSLNVSNEKKKQSIKKYFDYYNSENPKPEVLLQKMDSVNTSKRAFYTNAYTIEDLITTGNLALFPESERLAILKLKNVHEQYAFYEASTIQDVALYEQEIKKNFDLVILTGLSDRVREDTKIWQKDIESVQIKILNNSLVESLKLFEFQSEMYEIITLETTKLKTLLAN